MKIVVCCPTYRKFDLCVAMIESAMQGSIVPDAFVIIDNSAGGFTKYLQNNGILFDDTVAVMTPPTNVGVAAGWNLLLETVANNIDDALAIVVNDDILFEENTVKALSDAALEDLVDSGEYALVYCAGGIDAPNAFSLFAVHPQTFFKTIGRFDETLWPAYFDDNDMHYRMKLAGYELTRVNACNADHGEGSATIKAYTPEETELHHHQFRRNQEYFIRKWGGIPGEETYNTPFNGQSVMQHMIELFKRYGF